MARGLLAGATDAKTTAPGAQPFEAPAPEDQLWLGVLAGAASGADLAPFYRAWEDMDLARTHYRSLVQQADEIETLAALPFAHARIVAHAVPDDPDWQRIMQLSVLYAAVAALVVAIIRESLLSGVRSAAELAEAAGTPVAFRLPRLSSVPGDGASAADQVVRAPLAHFAQAIRGLQLNLQRDLPSMPGGRCVVITSVGDAEGKTTTALALARAFSANGQRVLLLDADLRMPGLHRQVDVPLRGGFQQVLEVEVSLSRLPILVRRDPLSQVMLLVNSAVSRRPAEELFGGATFASVLRNARASFDVVIIDMPSMRWAAEAAHILPHADAAVVVARWGRTPAESVREALAIIRHARPVTFPIMPVLSSDPEPFAPKNRRYQPAYSSV
ncbi:hypothetical protein DMC47_04620 [Nostoc sp. 3335mG]|nr:hypothetical protein DMC47_04620 [Nostoc sp. 3335mG]